jgi:hypothetical protein
MNIRYLFYGLFLAFLLITSGAHAVPTVGAATAISSNNFTVAITASDGGDVWVVWGGAIGNEIFGSQIQTGDCSLTVYGAPLMGGQTIWYKACDSTGCGNERSLTIPAITALPTPTFGNAYRNMSARHFSIDSIAPNILPGYMATGISATLLWGILFFFVIFGFWLRTRSVRMALMVGLLMAAFILTPTAGLMLGAPLLFQYVAQSLMAAAIAGIVLTFIRK